MESAEFQTRERRDSKASVRTDPSFISACLSDESFLGLPGGATLQCSPQPPFHLLSRVSPHSPPLTQIRSGAERGKSSCVFIQQSRQKPDTNISKGTSNKGDGKERKSPKIGLEFI